MSLQSFKVDCCYLLVNMQVFGKLKLVRTSKATSQDQYISHIILIICQHRKMPLKYHLLLLYRQPRLYMRVRWKLDFYKRTYEKKNKLRSKLHFLQKIRNKNDSTCVCTLCPTFCSLLEF